MDFRLQQSEGKGETLHAAEIKFHAGPFKAVNPAQMRQNDIDSCKAHLARLRALVNSQRPAQDFIKSLLAMMVQDALSTTWEGQPNEAEIPFKLEFFGSRRSEVALPSSDVDIVCILPQEIYCFLSKKHFLSRMLQWIEREPLCTSVKDACKAKSTVEFKCAGMKVDFTAHVGDWVGHTPLALTWHLKELLDQLPQLIRDLCLLTIDWAKRTGACFKGKGSIGTRLKGVHWLLLTLSFVLAPPTLDKNSHSDAAPLLLRQLFEFYGTCAFENRAVDSRVLRKNMTEIPFRHREVDAVAMWLHCPLDTSGNEGSSHKERTRVTFFFKYLL